MPIADPSLPDWRHLTLIQRVVLVPALLRAAAELARARLQLASITPLKIQALNQRATSATLRSKVTDPEKSISRIAFVIPRVAALLPWRAECLVQAIAAQRWLQNKGLPSHITIGTRRGEDGEFLAHAWLKMGDRIITGGDVSTYSPLLGPDANLG